MRGRVLNKLRSRAGESIAETLIAVLLIAVASTLLAGMITATANIVRQSKDTMDRYYTANAALENFEGAAAGEKVTITVGEGSTAVSIDVAGIKYATNSTFSDTPVISYQVSTGTNG